MENRFGVPKKDIDIKFKIPVDFKRMKFGFKVGRGMWKQLMTKLKIRL